MSNDSKVNLNLSSDNPEELASVIDNLMDAGTSRLKINMSDEMSEGQVSKVYHHGRCDVNSPFACGTPFN